MRLHGAFAHHEPQRFSIGHIIEDPISLATISIAIIAWILSFVGCIIADIKDKFPNYAWWALAHMFFLIIGIAYVVGTKSERRHQLAIVGHAAASLVFVTSAVNALIYQSQAPQEAASAGFILLSMVTIIWISHFGYTELPKHSSRPPETYHMPARDFHSYNHAPSITHHDPSQQVPDPTVRVQARALYDYNASPLDPNEISFKKGDILDVVDQTHCWWNVVLNNVHGIAPKNYLKIITPEKAEDSSGMH